MKEINSIKYNETLTLVIKYISEFHGIEEGKILENSSILWDLGIDGYDAYELLKGYSETFNVKILINLDEYFGDETGFNIILYIADFLRGKDTKKKKLLVRNLANSVLSGSLSDSDV